MHSALNKSLVALAACCFLLSAGSAAAAGDPVAGKAKSKPCAACHGADGNSTNPQFPRLAGQYSDYIVRALEEYKSGERKNPIMTGMAANLSAQDRADLAAYFSSQKGHLHAVAHAKPEP